MAFLAQLQPTDKHFTLYNYFLLVRLYKIYRNWHIVNITKDVAKPTLIAITKNMYGLPVDLDKTITFAETQYMGCKASSKL